MMTLLVFPLVLSFIAVLIILPYWIRKARQINLVWDDMNKIGKEKVSGSGGIVVILGFIIGSLSYVAYSVFYLNSANGFLVEIFALIAVILLLAGIGFVDDLLGWVHGGLSKRARIVLVAFASLPLIVINAGRSQIGLPFFGMIDVGILYPLILIPIGIVGATTTYNFLAGLNGLEAGQGIILVSAMSLVAYLTGSSWLAVVGLCMVVSLLAFLIFNFNPARVFPGDALTYGVGGLIAIMAILGNFEKIAVFFFIPVIIEVFLKGRGKYKKYSFGKPKTDGGLDLLYEKVYSLNHLGIFLLKKLNIKPTETKVVLFIWGFQILVILVGFWFLV